MARFKVGDKVLVRKDLIVSNLYNKCAFVHEMNKYKGRICTISQVFSASKSKDYIRYHIKEDFQYWFFSEDMLLRPKENGPFIKLALHV